MGVIKSETCHDASDWSKYDSTAYVPDSYYLQQTVSLVFLRVAVIWIKIDVWH